MGIALLRVWGPIGDLRTLSFPAGWLGIPLTRCQGESHNRLQKPSPEWGVGLSALGFSKQNSPAAGAFPPRAHWREGRVGGERRAGEWGRGEGRGEEREVEGAGWG